LLVGLHNQYLNQLARGFLESSASNRTRWTLYFSCVASLDNGGTM
jgi:hypothetical protein